MKAKLGGLGGIKTLVLNHGEKLGIALVAGLALFLVYKSLGRERLPDNRQAEDLRQQIQLARSSVENSNWEQAPPDQIRTPKPFAQSGQGMVDRADYENPGGPIRFNTPLVPPTVLRTDPNLLEAQDLEAYGGSGLLAFTSETIRKNRALEEATKAARRDQQQQQEREEMQREQQRGGRRGRRGREQDRFGQRVDPEHPNRRPVATRFRDVGVPQQGDEEVITAYWATVVAKVPVKDQLRAFDGVFEEARGYNEAADVPNYIGYLVERAEVRPGDDELNWTPVRVYNGRDSQPVDRVVSAKALYGEQQETRATEDRDKDYVTADWAAIYPEIVDPRFLDPAGVLAFPLPPLVGRDFGYDLAATHSEIPLAEDAVELEEEEPLAEEAAGPTEGEEEEEGSLFGSATTGPTQQFGRGGRSPYAGRGAPGAYRGMSRGMGGYGGEMGMMSEYGGLGGYGRGMEGGYGAPMRGGMGRGDSIRPRVDNYLLRFFDFSVEPGRKYKYRVRLALRDPNRRALKAHLDPSVHDRYKKDKSDFRLTEWSKPSRTVSIPLAGTVRVASADPASDRSFTSEPETTLLVESFDADESGKPIQAAIEAEFRRGSVANLTEDAEGLVEQGRYIDEYEDFEFRTGITIVDIRGGETLSRRQKLNTEARVLLMDPGGQLFVQKESDDLDAVEQHRAVFAESDENSPYGGGRGFQGGRGMEMMEFRGR